MKLFNYLKVAGAFTQAYQPITLAAEPKDRQEKKMLEEALKLSEATWARRQVLLQKRAAETGEPVDLDAEKAAIMPVHADGTVTVLLQFVQDYMIKKMAAIQNNTSIHNKEDVAELMGVFKDYGVALTSEIKGLTLDFLSWSAKERQKPKLLVHAKAADGEPVCIRFEAASELCQKFMNSVLTLSLVQGKVFDLRVEAVDPAIERNKKAGKKVADEGRFVNHNLYLTCNGVTQTGHPPKGTKFVQKMTLEEMEALYHRTARAIQAPAEDI